MKRFFLFGGYSYIDPRGGWGDFKNSFDTVTEAIMFVAKSSECRGWFQIIDSLTGENIENWRE